MSLSGNVNDLPLSDLLQINATNRRTCVISIRGPLANGRIYLEKGELVNAHYGDLKGNEAVYAVLAAEDISYQVKAATKMPHQNTTRSWQSLIMESAQFLDEGKIPRIQVSDRRSKSMTIPTWPKTTGKRHRRILLASVLLLLVSGGLAWKLYDSQKGGPSPISVAEKPAHSTLDPPDQPMESTGLIGPDDVLPRLLSGRPPALPEVGISMAPTVVCRLLIDPLGRVNQAKIYRSRLELAAFEEAALEAVAHYRFSPGRKQGDPVWVWVNWPVSFAEAAPMDAAHLRIKGSDTIGGSLGPDLVKDFAKTRPNLEFSVESLGSSTAFAGLFDGSADIGASSRSVKDTELDKAAKLGLKLREFVIGYDGIAIIVHPDNAVERLTLEEAALIFSGTIRNWRELGAGDMAIRLICRPSYSGTHSFFKSKVLRRGNKNGKEEFPSGTRYVETTEQIVKMVARDPGAVSFVGLGWAGDEVKTLPMAPGPEHEAVLPRLETIRNGSYPIYRPLMMYTAKAPRGAVREFLNYVLSARGQKLVEGNGFVAIDTLPGTLFENDEKDEPETASVKRIFFHGGGAKLDRQAGLDLMRAVREISQTGCHVLVVGNADSEGSAAHNFSLAQNRALAVAEFLERAGVDPAGIQIDVSGENLPIASNESAQGRQENRRVDLFLIKK